MSQNGNILTPDDYNSNGSVVVQLVMAVHLDSQHGSLHLKMLLTHCGASGKGVRLTKLGDSSRKQETN